MLPPRAGTRASTPAVPPRLTLGIPRHTSCAKHRKHPLVRHVTDATDPAYQQGASRRSSAQVKHRCVLPGGSGDSFKTSCAGFPPDPDSLKRGFASTSPLQSLFHIQMVKLGVYGSVSARATANTALKWAGGPASRRAPALRPPKLLNSFYWKALSSATPYPFELPDPVRRHSSFM